MLGLNGVIYYLVALFLFLVVAVLVWNMFLFFVLSLLPLFFICSSFKLVSIND